MADNIIRVLNAYEAEIVRLNRRVLEESPDLIAIIGSDYVYYYVNPIYADIHGMKREDFIGFPVQKFLGSEVFDSIVRPNMERCILGENVHYEDWFEFTEGDARYMDVRYLPLHDADGRIDRIVVVSRDISYRIEAEEARIAREKLQTIVDLAGTYNHKINNPLCALVGYLELLGAGETDPKRLKYLENSKIAVNRISEVTSKIAKMTSVKLTEYPGGAFILDLDEEKDQEEA
ncbi:MAG: PAS domain-containing protein [Candidatus Latescibacterota bacterium]